MANPVNAIDLAQAMSPVVLLGRRLGRATAVSIAARACLVARASSAKVSARASNAKPSAREQWLHWSESSARDRGLVAALLLVLTPLAFNASVASLRAIGPPCVEFDACVAVASLHALRFAVRGAEWCLGVDSHHVACRAHTAMVAGAVLAYQGMQPVAAAMVICVALCVEERHLWSPLGVRTDVETKTLLRSLQPPHYVHASMAHGENNCLIDSVLLALGDQKIVCRLDVDARAAICRDVRRHLVGRGVVSPDGFPFLSHELHAHVIFEHLRDLGQGFWCSGVLPQQLSCTVVAFDKSHGQMLIDVNGGASELPDVSSVHSPAPCAAHAVREVLIQLYCNSFDDSVGTPYHYEWISHAPGPLIPICRADSDA